MEMTKQITAGVPTPEELVSPVDQSDHSSGSEQEDWHRAPVETTPGDARLWGEILHNLSKDVSKHSCIMLSDSSLAGAVRHQQKAHEQPLTNKDIIAFSCGHVFSEPHFHSKVLLDFAERLQDLPVPIPLTASFLQQYYRQTGAYSCACPYCVFQYLRRGQLDQCPKVPIRPWNP